ncbi:MAG: hypothetical protein KY476_08625 [Planctomycetes bacterium]|nr:hypothetical protein [Planctomycetota bacterium]
MGLRDLIGAIFSRQEPRDFQRERIFRAAEFTCSWDAPADLFELVGVEAAQRVLRARSRRERELLGDLSLAYEFMAERLAPDGRFFASYVNQLEQVLRAWLEIVREPELTELVLRRFREFRDRCQIPAEDSEERLQLLAALYEPGPAPIEFQQRVLTSVPTLARLYRIRDELSGGTGPQFEEPMSHLGLRLLQVVQRHLYWCTPVNAITFAGTGGDGTHFSLVEIDGVVSEQSPVVMTIPTGGNELNRVVGGSLREFLALGLHCGYFVLDQISRDSEFDRRLQLSEQQRRTLERLALEFALEPWNEPLQRLSELKRLVYPQLVFPVNADGTPQG